MNNKSSENLDMDFEVDVSKLNEEFEKCQSETESEMNKDLEEDGLADLKNGQATIFKPKKKRRKKNNHDAFDSDNNTENNEPEIDTSDMAVSSALSMYLNSIYEIGEYTQEQLNEKVEKFKAARDAGDTEKAIRYRNDIVEHNLKLVVSAAKHFRTGYKTADFNDAIQSGNVGLIKAAEYYDPSRGFHFSTYAWWWIRQGIHRNAQENMTSLRVSAVLADDINKAKHAISDLEKMNSKDASKILQKKFTWTPKHASEVVRYANMQNFTSLNTHVGNKNSDDSESELGTLVADPDGEFTAEVDKKIIEKQLCDIVESLPSKRTSDIIKRYYGLAGYAPQTLEEIGAEYCVTHQAIQRALKNGLALLARKPELHDRLALLDTDSI